VEPFPSTRTAGPATGTAGPPQSSRLRGTLAAPRADEGRGAAPSPSGAPSIRPNGFGYFPGLDGVRAISVIAVLLYHAEVSGMKGGFLGVEVFFVISGYLITSLLLGEEERSGAVSLRQFWIRRARRLLPAMYAVVLATLVVSALFLREELASLRGDAVAAIFYVSNWSFIVAEKSYFEASGRPSLLQHLWSLAVEEQFYLLWPVLFVGGMRWLGRRRFVWAILGGAAASWLLMVVLYGDGSSAEARNRVYLGTDTRASGLLIGCALAFVWMPRRIRSDRAGRHAGLILDVAGVLALVGIGWMFAATSQFSNLLYRGGFVVLALLTAVVIAAVVHPASHLNQVVGCLPLRWLGVRSYGIYLWHWPIFQLTRPGLDVPFDGGALFVLRMGLTLAVAAMSYRYLEQPIRQGGLGRSWARFRVATGSERQALRQRWLAGVGSLAVVLAIVVGLSVTATTPTAELTSVSGGAGVPGVAGTGAAAAIDPRNFSDAAVDPNAVADPFADQSTTTETAVPGTTDPVAATVGSDVPGSEVLPPESTVPEQTPPTPPTLPRLAPPLNAAKIALLGDSVMLGASPAVQQLLGPNAVIAAKTSRQVSDGIDIVRGWKAAGWLGEAAIVVHLGNNGTFFEQQFDQMMQELKDAPRVVFLTVRVPRPWQDSVNETIRAGVERHKDKAVLVDWQTFSEGHPDWFYTDGMHLDPNGAPHYAELLASAL